MVTGTGTPPIDPSIGTATVIGRGMLTRATTVRDSMAIVAGEAGVDGVGGVGGGAGSRGRALRKRLL